MRLMNDDPSQYRHAKREMNSVLEVALGCCCETDSRRAWIHSNASSLMRPGPGCGGLEVVY